MSEPEPETQSTTLRAIPCTLFVQSLMIVTAMCVRDAITRTLSLLPVPTDGVAWSWGLALFHVVLVMVFLWIFMRYRMVSPRMVA